MRIMGFAKKWDKLQRPEFTTFRFPRRDRDWEQDEIVQVVIKPRTKERQIIGNAQIIRKESRDMNRRRDNQMEWEAQEDGFANAFEMWLWLKKTHGDRYKNEPMNKLTLRQELPK